MWFKNLQLYALPPEWTPTAAAVEEALARHPLLPCNAASMQSQGWVAPAPGDALVYSQGRHLLVTLGIEQKILPASVINQAAQQKAETIEKQQGFPLGRKQMRDLKDQVADELRPRAFVRKRTVRAWFDFENHRLIVDTASPKMADELTTVFRADFGDLPCVPLDTQQSPGAAMTAWLASSQVPGPLSLQDDCELSADNAAKSVVRYVRHSLDGPELRSLISGGKTVTRLGLGWREHLSFGLTDKLTVKRLRFVSLSEDDGGSAKKDDADAFDANFTLMHGELSAMLNDVVDALGGAKAA